MSAETYAQGLKVLYDKSRELVKARDAFKAEYKAFLESYLAENNLNGIVKLEGVSYGTIKIEENTKLDESNLDTISNAPYVLAFYDLDGKQYCYSILSSQMQYLHPCDLPVCTIDKCKYNCCGYCRDVDEHNICDIRRLVSDAEVS